MFFFDLEPGGSSFAYRKVDETGYEITSNDYVLSVNNGNVVFSIVLPDPSLVPIGKTYIIKKFDQTSTDIISISSAAGLVQDSDGIFKAAVGILNAWGSYNDKRMFMNNGTNWEYIS